MDPAVVLDRAEVDEVIQRSAAPVAARSALIRILETAPQLADDLDVPERRRAIVAVVCASQSLASAIVADPSMLDALRSDLGPEEDVESYRRSAEESVGTTVGADGALRRWKRRAYLRIAARDLSGHADLSTIARELAALAEVSLQVALRIVDPTEPFAVIGMGKLGGSELNYASDVDVVFVHEGDLQKAERVARALLTVMSGPTVDGIVFRTDADLRPEGRAGAMSRTIESYAAWYERWARPWEFQALIKARPVAGDTDLGAHFMEMSRRFVWPDALDPEAVREARTMKARAEADLERRGLSDRELKRGRGGIRDIEFAVQLLQRVHGCHDDTIRSPGTLNALAQLVAGGYVEREDARRLDDAYVFLRTVEHRLQLWEEHQTHTLPQNHEALVRLARVTDFRDGPRASALEQFEEAHRSHQAAVRSIHERLFFAPILDTLAGAGALDPDAAEERLAAFGFADTGHTRAALRELTRGLTRRSRLMQQLLPVILDWLSAAPDPDLGLLQLRKLAEGPTRAAALATTFRDKPGAAERVCRVLGSSRLVGDALLRQPETVELLGDDEWLVRERGPGELMSAALETLQWRDDADARRAGLRRFKRRELLRIGARDLLGLVPVDVTARELSDLADASVEAALRSLAPALPFTVIAMGRLGGQELSFASDIDVLFVYDGTTSSNFEVAERTAAALLREIGATTAEGQTFDIDARLRPEGKLGPLARSLDGYRQYYDTWAQVWERQSLLRARVIAGNWALGARFLEMIEGVVYRSPFPEADAKEIRRVKARVERERIPPGEDPEFHLKLGPGALTDVEFTVQLLQLQHGVEHPMIRTPSTAHALRLLTEASVLQPEDATILAEAYQFCERARNARYLVTGKPGDSLPLGADAARLGLLLGFVHRPETRVRDEFRRVTRRARRVVDRVFYERG